MRASVPPLIGRAAFERSERARTTAIDRWLAAQVQRTIDPAAVRLELWDGRSPSDVSGRSLSAIWSYMTGTRCSASPSILSCSSGKALMTDGTLLVGDAAGLAYPESGEGIRPAIESGRLAAQTLISAGNRHGVDDLRPYADTLRRLHPPAPGHPAPVRATAAAVGRFLLGSPVFTRHVVLDRWFLRT
jgi:hypothetical protein